MRLEYFAGWSAHHIFLFIIALSALNFHHLKQFKQKFTVAILQFYHNMEVLLHNKYLSVRMVYFHIREHVPSYFVIGTTTEV
jgi:hypothetical protein